MTPKVWKMSVGAAALAACALAGATVAFGAGSASKTTTGTTTTTAGKSGHTPETPLTGDVLAKVKAAAIAKVGGTVDSATTENDSSNSAAAYEAHVTKADGTHVTVILDSSFNVLATEAGHGGPGHGDHHRGPGGNGETALTDDTATQAKTAAVAKTGGTAEEATTETDSNDAAAAYEVHVTKSDGTHVVVILDKSFAVLGVETHDHGPGGPDGDSHFRHA
jgi:uncharacterized membrane protein YkoI